jgi:hypothetical protein
VYDWHDCYYGRDVHLYSQHSCNKTVTNKKKCVLAVALAVWILGAIYLGSKTFDEYRSGKQPTDGADMLSIKRIMLPSLMMRDKE